MKAPIVKKVPMRKCVITGNQFPKKDLLRVVREPDGNITNDIGRVDIFVPDHNEALRMGRYDTTAYIYRIGR